jgi:hypothetical protein
MISATLPRLRTPLMKAFPLPFIAVTGVLIAVTELVYHPRLGSAADTADLETATLAAPPARPPRPPFTPTAIPDTTAAMASRSSEENQRADTDTAADTDTRSAEFWRAHLAELLNNDHLPDRELGQKLATVASDAHTPLGTRVDAITQALLFIDDGDYDRDMKRLAVRADLPESVHTVILDDLMHRDPAAILPAAREIAETSGHPLSDAVGELVRSIEEGAQSTD